MEEYCKWVCGWCGLDYETREEAASCCSQDLEPPEEYDPETEMSKEEEQ